MNQMMEYVTKSEEEAKPAITNGPSISSRLKKLKTSSRPRHIPGLVPAIIYGEPVRIRLADIIGRYPSTEELVDRCMLQKAFYRRYVGNVDIICSGTGLSMGPV